LKRAAFLTAAAALVLCGCGQSVATGGENAATHPASGYSVSQTIGGAGFAGPTVPTTTPPSTAPETSAERTAISRIEQTVTNGCWQDAHQGNVWGATDQVFWYPYSCGSTIAQIAIEVYPSAAKAAAEAGHGVSTATSPPTFYQGGANLVQLAMRYQDGSLLVDVYSTAPEAAQAQVASLSVLKAVGH
jgi:hypothetical protein